MKDTFSEAERRERRDGQYYCENIPRNSECYLSHLAPPDLVDIEPAGGPAAAPGVVVVGPQVVAGQRGVEHGQLSLSLCLSVVWNIMSTDVLEYLTSAHLSSPQLRLKQIFVRTEI